MRRTIGCLCVFAIGFMFLMSPVYAAEANYTVGTICEIQMADNGNVLFRPCTRWNSVGGNNDRFIQFRTSATNGKTLYATLLTAYAVGDSVVVRIDDSDSSHTYDFTSKIGVVN